jgi:hypothetical protein
MAHYAFIDHNNVVVSLIAGREETDTSRNWETHYANFQGFVCKRYSINTIGNVNEREGGVPFRKNCAQIGGLYDPVLDAFYAKQPYPSWILNQETCIWEAPTPKPEAVGDWHWNEETLVWDNLIAP